MNKVGLILVLAALLGAGAAALLIGSKSSVEPTPAAVVSTPAKSSCCPGH